jgi:hypothetical protein
VRRPKPFFLSTFFFGGIGKKKVNGNCEEGETAIAVFNDYLRPKVYQASFSISASQASLSPAIVQKHWCDLDEQDDTVHG